MSVHNDANDIAHVMDALFQLTSADSRSCVSEWVSVCVFKSDYNSWWHERAVTQKMAAKNKSGSFRGRNNVDGLIYMHIFSWL